MSSRGAFDWNHWKRLELWPLDAACKLISGDNPDVPTRRQEIENPDSTNRPAWVNVYHTLIDSIDAGTLKAYAGRVRVAEFLAWAQKKGFKLPDKMPPELLAMADEQVAIKADRAHSGKRAGAATATRKARKADRSGDLKQFIEDVYEALENVGHEVGENGSRKPLPVSVEDLRTLFLVRHPEHKVARSTFDDDLGKIATVKPGPKRCDIKAVAEMLAGTFSG